MNLTSNHSLVICTVLPTEDTDSDQESLDPVPYESVTPFESRQSRALTPEEIDEIHPDPLHYSGTAIPYDDDFDDEDDDPSGWFSQKVGAMKTADSEPSITDLIDELDEEEDIIDDIYEAESMEEALKIAVEEISLYGQEVGFPTPDEEILAQDPEIKSWVNEIRTGITED